MALTGATGGYEQNVRKRRFTSVRWPTRLDVSSSTLVMLGAITALHVMTALLFISGSASGEASGWGRLPIDDAWTRMTYIRNFSDSFVFQYNSGEAATGATSPLWIALNGTLAAILGIGSDGLPGLAKALGILFGVASVCMTFRITWQITRKRYFGLLAAAVLAVEPHFGFAAVSGTEVTLFAAISLFASWAFLRGRIRTSGVFVALAIIARPEGLLLAALITGTTLARWMWRRDGAIFEHRRDVHDIAWLAVPSLAVTVIWVVFNWSITGSALPDSYLATSETLGLLPLSNLWSVWLGYGHQLPFMLGLAWLVGLPLIMLGGYTLLHRHSFSAIPIALCTLLLVYAAMVTFTKPESPWLFEDRRHMDAALPFIVILLFVGTARAWQFVWAWRKRRNPQTERERKAVLITARVAVIALLIAPLAALPAKWDSLTTEYSWTTRNTNDAHVATGQWLNENTPENAVIGAVPAGAISFFAERNVLDLSGKSAHEAQGKPPLAYGLEQDVDYLVALRGPFFDSIPGRAVVNEERAGFGNPYFADTIRTYGPEGSGPDIELPREQFAAFDLSTLGFNFTIIDTLDTGNGFAPAGASEAEHGYGIDGERTDSEISANVRDGFTLTDDARIFRFAEEFSVTSQSGTPLVIVKRYDASVAGSVRVLIDGADAGEWNLPSERSFFGESAFAIPGELVTQNRVTLRFEVIPGQTAIAGSSFFYWILVPVESG